MRSRRPPSTPLLVKLGVERLPLANLWVGVHRLNQLGDRREGGGDVILWDAVDDAGRQPADEPPDGKVRHRQSLPDGVAARAILGADLLDEPLPREAVSLLQNSIQSYRCTSSF